MTDPQLAPVAAGPARWAEAAWRAACRRPVLTLLLILAVQVIPSLWARELWHIDELRHAGVFFEMMEHGHWLALHLNGLPYGDKPPVYFWMLGAMSRLFGTQDPWIFFAVTGICAAVMLWATVRLARATLPGLRGAGLVAGLVLLTNIFFIERAHYPRMDLLFAAFIALSAAALFRAVQSGARPGGMVAGCVLAGLAVLTKGPYGALVPLGTLVLFLLWQRRPGRLLAWDVAAGLAVLAAMMAGYLGALYAVAGPEYLAAMQGYVGGKVDEGGGLLAFNLHLYLGHLAMRTIPWSVVLLVALPWLALRRCRRAAPPPPGPAPRRDGMVFLGIMVAATLLGLSLIDYVHHFFLMMVYPPLAVLAAAVLLRLGTRGMGAVALGLGGLLCALGVVVPLLGPGNPLGIIIETTYPPAMGLLAVLTGGAMILVRRAGAGPVMLVFALGITALIQPHFLRELPKLDREKSTALPAARMTALIAQGYRPVIYPNDLANFFEFYARRRFEVPAGPDALVATLGRGDKVVLAVQDGVAARLGLPGPGAEAIFANPRRMGFTLYRIDPPAGG